MRDRQTPARVAAALLGLAAFASSPTEAADQPMTGLSVAQFECVAPTQTEKLNRLREMIRRVTLHDSGAVVIVMRDGAVLFVQPGAGCIVAMAPNLQAAPSPR